MSICVAASSILLSPAVFKQIGRSKQNAALSEAIEPIGEDEEEMMEGQQLRATAA
jgi:hypothetical protein